MDFVLLASAAKLPPNRAVCENVSLLLWFEVCSTLSTEAEEFVSCLLPPSR